MVSFAVQKLRSLIAAAAAAKSLQSCPTLCDPIDGSPPGSPIWDSPGKNTGVGCHFLLQCMKVKSEREVSQSCPTLRNLMDCSLPGSSVHGICQARVLEWATITFSKQRVWGTVNENQINTRNMFWSSEWLNIYLSITILQEQKASCKWIYSGRYHQSSNPQGPKDL